MKKLMSISLFVLMLGFFQTTMGQDAEQKVKQDARKVGNKTAEISSKAKSKVTDKTYEDKVGPDRQTVYIDRHSKYYWVDKKGHKRYAKKEELRDK